MQTAATNDASIVSATASSYYKCADGTAPPTSPVLTMTGTASIDCSANHNAARAGLRLRGKPSTPLVPRLAIQIVFTVAIALAGFVPG
jgi:hypothetical protein